MASDIEKAVFRIYLIYAAIFCFLLPDPVPAKYVLFLVSSVWVKFQTSVLLFDIIIIRNPKSQQSHLSLKILQSKIEF